MGSRLNSINSDTTLNLNNVSNQNVVIGSGGGNIGIGGAAGTEKLKITGDVNITGDLITNTNLNLSYLEASQAVFTDASKNLISVDILDNILTSVKDYGAVGDGVTDDTAAFQAAIDAAAPYVWQGSVAATNAAQQVVSKLFVPIGTYKITSPLLLSKGLHIFGETGSGFGQGSNQSYILADFDDMSAYILDSAPFITNGTRPLAAVYSGADNDAGIVTAIHSMIIENISIGVAGGRSILGGMNLTVCSQSHIKNCSIVNTNVGIRLTASWAGSFRDNHIYTKAQGIYCNLSVTTWDIQNNYISVINTPDIGYVFPGGETNSFDLGTEIYGNYACILAKFSGPIIKNNTLERGNIGIAVESCGTINMYANYMEIIEQYCYVINTGNSNIIGGYTLCPAAKLLWVSGAANQSTMLDFRGVAPVTVQQDAFVALYVDRVIYKTSQDNSLLYNSKIEVITPEQDKGTNTIWLSSSGNDTYSGNNQGNAVLTLQEAFLRIKPGMYNQIIIPASETVNTTYTFGSSNASAYIIPSTSLSISSLGTGVTRGTINVTATSGEIHALQMEGGFLNLSNVIFSIAEATNENYRAFIRTLGVLSVSAFSCDFTGISSSSAVFGGRQALASTIYINSILCNFNTVHFIKEATGSGETGTVTWTENNSGSTFTTVTTDQSYKIVSKQFPSSSVNDLTAQTLTLTGTAASTSNTTGVLTSTGGIGISNTTDAVSSTNGGSLTTAGGAAIAKSLYVGGRSEISSTLRFTSFETPTSGQGLELNYNGSVGNIYAYDRDLTQYKTLNLNDFLSVNTTINASSDLVFTGNNIIRRNTTDGADDGVLVITGGGGDSAADRGAKVFMFGNENPGFAGQIGITAGSTGFIGFYTGSQILRGSVSSTGIWDFPVGVASTSSTVGALTLAGGISISNTTDSTSFTNGGSLTSAGGFAFAKTGFIGGNLEVGFGNPFVGERGIAITNTDSGNGSYPILRINNDSSSGLVAFLNSSTRTADGGINNATIRNDIGELNLQGDSSLGINIDVSGIVTVQNTAASTSSTVGALKLPGGISISNTTNATSATNGGTFTTAGGIAVSKSGYIGQSLNVAQNTTTNTLTATSFIQDYAPVTLSNTVEFYGDSIVLGSGVTSIQRWSYLVTNNYAKTEDNNAVAGAQWVGDISIQVYDNHTSGNTAFIGLGMNSTQYQPVESIYSLSACVESMCMYCSLPSTNIINARSGSVTTVGTWTNNTAFTTVGSGTTDFGVAYKEVTVTGRYIGCSITTTTNNTDVSYGRYSLIVDGTTVVTNAPFTSTIVNSVNGSNYISQLIFYDTGISGIGVSHTFRIVIDTAIGGFSSDVFVDYFFGFDQGVVGASPVFLNSIPRYDPGTPAVGLGNNTFRQNLNKEYYIIAYKFRKIFGLPVYYMVNTGEYSVPGMTLDLLLPSPVGHRWIADRVIDIINNGEANYLMSS